jgi:hypothetical protein
MTYSNDVVTKGNSYEVYRKGILLKQNWHGIIDNISNSGHLHIGFLGIADIQKGDILKDSDNHTYYVMHTALKTLYSKDDKLLIICEPNDVRQNRISLQEHQLEAQKRKEQEQKELEQKRYEEEKRRSWIQFWIPLILTNIISASALVISILAYIKQ